MSEQPCFTVVIPAYNYGHCLERALRSALEQDYPCYQVLVIDDGSTDDTPDVVARLQEQDLVFDAIRQENAGLSEVRNRGIREARHDWLVFLDADDEMLPGALMAMADAIRQAPEARLVVAGHESLFPDQRRRRITPHPVSADSLHNLSLYLNKTLSICNGACAMHRELFSGISYRRDMRQTEDLPVFAHTIANYPMTTTAQPVACIHKHATSMRHDVEAARALGMDLERIIFEESGLPEGAKALRSGWRSRRALSLLKLCYRAGDYDGAVAYFHQALRARPLTALAPRYLRRYVVSLWKR